MAYLREGNVKKSIERYVIDTIHADGTYSVGEGSTQLMVYDAFPADVSTFHIPSVSIDFESWMRMRQYDMGCDVTYPYNIYIDVWGKSQYESEYITSILSDALEKSRMEYRNYNLNIDGACITTYMDISQVVASPQHVVTPGLQSENRYEISFILELTTNYK